MIYSGEKTCPYCGSDLKYYDKVSRIVRTKGNIKKHVEMRRFRCVTCEKTHRELPENVIPYKHYESEIISGVLEGHITTDTLGFEDFPCESTMARWRTQSIQITT